MRTDAPKHLNARKVMDGKKANSIHSTTRPDFVPFLSLAPNPKIALFITLLPKKGIEIL